MPERPERSSVASHCAARPIARLVPRPMSSSVLPCAIAQPIVSSTSLALRGLRVSAIARLLRGVGGGCRTCKSRHDLARETTELPGTAGDGEQDIADAGALQGFEHRADFIWRAEKRVLLGAT